MKSLVIMLLLAVFIASVVFLAIIKPYLDRTIIELTNNVAYAESWIVERELATLNKTGDKYE